MANLDRRKIEEQTRKAAEALLRLVGISPEIRSARKLGQQARDWDGSGGLTGSPKVLIVSPRDWVAHVQYEAVIAHALRLRGADVRFLTCGGGLEICDRTNLYEGPPMPCRSCAHYVENALDAHGFPRTSIRQSWEREDPVPWDELDEVPTWALKDVAVDGLALGKITDLPLKWFLCAAELQGDPLAGQTARAFLRSARRIAAGVRANLEADAPDVVLLLNGLFLFEGIAWALCQEMGIDVVTYERAFLKETLVFHRGAPAGFYDLSEDWASNARPLTAPESLELDGYIAQRRAGLAFDQYWRFDDDLAIHPDGGRLVTLFTNLTWDTAVIDRDCAFDGIQDWIETVIQAFATRAPHHLVVRIHPSERHLPGKMTRDSLEAFINRRFPRLPTNVSVIGADDLTSSYPLMDASDLGLVYTSTTGLELALAGTPVIVAGHTHYRGKGFTIDVSSPDELLEVLDRTLDDPSTTKVDVEMARQYAHFFFFRAPIRAPYVTEPLPGLARLTTSDLNQLAPGVNHELDRICEGILHGKSFVR